jgi:hypothetical protein
MRKGLIILGTGALGSLLIGVTGAGAVTHPATPGGVIHVAVVSYNGAPNHDIITGAFADAGYEHPIRNALSKVILSRGTLEVNSTALSKAINNAYGHLSVTANCSAFLKVSGTVTLGDGTGAYSGISGTLNATVSSVFVLPTKANGQCNESNSAQPIGQILEIAASGTVAFKS